MRPANMCSFFSSIEFRVFGQTRFQINKITSKDKERKMAESAEVERKSLIEQGLHLGIPEEKMARLPNYDIRDLLLKASEDRRRHSSRHKHRHSRRDSPVFREMEQHSAQVMQELKNGQPNLTEPEDDTETLIDMSYSADAKNPTDEKFKRYNWLMLAQNTIREAIAVNTQVLEAKRADLEPDDIHMLEKAIQADKEKMRQNNIEMQQIYHWLNEIATMKMTLYNQVKQNCRDTSGVLGEHFDRKMQKIQEYMRFMHEKVQNQKV